MRRLGFLGKGRMDAARKLLPTAVDRWREQWSFVDALVPWDIECVEETALAQPVPLASLPWQKAQCRSGAIWLAAEYSDAWQSMIFGLFAQEIPDDETARYLLAQAQLALVNALLEELEQGRAERLLNEAPESVGAYFGARLAMRISMQGASLCVVMDADLLGHLLSSPPVRQPLADRQAAIAKSKIKLHVRLPFAATTLGDISDLQPGDILRTSTRLDRPLALTAGPAEVVAEGYLARSQDHLALQLSN